MVTGSLQDSPALVSTCEKSLAELGLLLLPVRLVRLSQPASDTHAPALSRRAPQKESPSTNSSLVVRCMCCAVFVGVSSWCSRTSISESVRVVLRGFPVLRSPPCAHRCALGTSRFLLRGSSTRRSRFESFSQVITAKRTVESAHSRLRWCQKCCPAVDGCQRCGENMQTSSTR